MTKQEPISAWSFIRAYTGIEHTQESFYQYAVDHGFTKEVRPWSAWCDEFQRFLDYLDETLGRQRAPRAVTINLFTGQVMS